jgi:hypothetical protein
LVSKGGVNKSTRRVTVTGTELNITTHQRNAETSGVQGVYLNSIIVILDTVIGGELISRGTRGETA